MNQAILPIATVENARKVGDRLWFEYHCWESHSSSDATIWYRSHQQVEVLGMGENDGCDIQKQDDRYELGHQLVYRVRFDDGLEWHVFEDELLDSAGEFGRAAPPEQP